MPSASNSGPRRTLPLSAVKRIDDACDAYEQAFAAGTNPRIEDLLAKAPEAELERAALLRDLLALEVDLRLTRGETLTLDDYASRFPGEVAWLRGLLTERTKPLAGAAVPLIGEKLRYFGDYELLEVIGRGGMGVVYKARQMKLNRIVALKMILSGRLANDEELRRFKSEAEAAANLEHPDIVPIFEVGEHQGQHYFAMQFIDGQSLADRVVEGPLPPREAAELVRRVAAAVQFAHDHAVIHRDLKPGNVLLDASGKPFVTDFGLAKRIDGDSNLTRSGQPIGTPSYMPPEQASGKAQQSGPASDVYSLGAMLYCLVVGRPPFQAATSVETVQQVLRDEPVAPRQLNPAVPRDLETICLKCLNKDPARRYPTAQALADELSRWLRSEPILARPASMIERAWRWTNRHPSAASAIAAVALGLTAVSILSFALWRLNTNLATSNASLKLASEREQGLRMQAEENLQFGFESVDELVTSVSESELGNDPRFRKTQEKLHHQAIAHFSRIAEVSSDRDRRDVQSRIGFAQHGLGMVATHAGNTKEAMSRFQAAVQIRESLANEFPRDIDTQRQLAISLGMIARTLRREGKTAESRTTLQRAQSILAAALREQPLEAQARRDMAVLLDHLGLLDRGDGRNDAALSTFQQGLRIWNELRREFPSELVYAAGAVKAAVNVASAQEQLGDQPGALQTLIAMRPLLAQLEAAGYLPEETGRSFATVEQNCAILAQTVGDLEAAETAFQRAIAVGRRLVEPEPSSQRIFDLADTLGNYALLKVDMKHLDQALDLLRESRGIWERSKLANPESPQAAFELAKTDRRIGETLYAAKQFAEARGAFEKARQELDAILPKLPSAAFLQIESPRVRIGLASNHLAQGQTDGVNAILDAALSEGKKLLEKSPTEAVRLAMADLHEAYAEFFERTSQLDKMQGSLKTAVDILEKLVIDNPKLHDARTRLKRLKSRIADAPKP